MLVKMKSYQESRLVAPHKVKKRVFHSLLFPVVQILIHSAQ